VFLINPETQLLETEISHGMGNHLPCRRSPGTATAAWVALHGAPLRTPPSDRQPSELAVPLFSRHDTLRASKRTEEQVIGVLAAVGAPPPGFTVEDENLLLSVSNQASSLIQNAWLYEHALRQTRLLDMLLQSSRSLMTCETLPEVLKQASQHALLLANASHCAILLLNEDASQLTWRISSGHPPPPACRSIPVDLSQLGIVIHRRKPHTMLDFRRSDPLLDQMFARHKDLISALAVPLHAGHQTLGTLLLFTPERHRFSNEEIDALNTLANLTAIAMQRCQFSQKLLSVEDQLRQDARLSAIGLLAAEVAHEIRNPLTVTKMLAHSLLRDATADAQRKDLEMLSRKMDQMEHTVARVLRLARDSEPVLAPLSLNSVAEDLQLLVRHKLTQSGIQLNIRLASDAPPIQADRGQIEQALLNIVLNSLNAMPGGGMLRISTGYNSSRLWIDVRDSGSGIPSRRKTTLFQPFLSTSRAGTGLGMAIVKRIVDAHHGQIDIRSRQGHGTRVRLSFPIATP
jgi:signal transduction histidine kinase